ncbi:MAG: T9SS type A sorting domain-containing protein [Chloroherpetonaceae bacterium]|nr:T9SS type A sorting domain-containing protein [Chloroherpetonaceae bacterium]
MKHTLKPLFLSIFLLISTSLSAQWTSIQGTSDFGIFTFQWHRDTLLAGGYEQIYKSLDSGKTWSLYGFVSSEDDISSITDNATHTFAGTFSKGVYYSTNGGKDWIDYSQGLEGLGAKSISSLVILGDSIYAATQGEGVFVSNLKALSGWSNYREGMFSAVTYVVNAMTAVNDTLVLGAGANGAIQYRKRGAAQWEYVDLQQNAVGLTANDFAIHKGALFVGSGVVPAAFRSFNSGKTWENCASGLQGGIFPKIVSNGSVLFYAGNSASGVVRISASTNDGDSWQLLDTESPTTLAAMIPIGNRLLVSRTQGLYWFDATLLSAPKPLPVKPVQDFVLHQNFPNPFNPSTTISFQLLRPSSITLEVFDAIGRKVETLAQGFRSAGLYQETFQGKALSSGMYLYLLKTGSSSQTQRMLLIK